MRFEFAPIVGVLMAVSSPTPAFPQPRADASAVVRQHLTVGLFIGSIEEGARIFTPVRFLPPEHPEALGHDFPTVLQFHDGEDRLLVELGKRAGFLLGPTLQRYPTEPDTLWPYPAFARPPAEDFLTVVPKREKADASPLPGLRAVAYMGRFPLAFIIDTRGMSLPERQMDRATSSGLDVSRSQVLEALRKIAASGPPEGPWMLVYDRP